MRLSHFTCQTLWNTSFEVVFQNIIGYGWQAARSEWQYRSHPYNAVRTGLGGGWKYRTNVYAACSGGVVVVVLGDLVAWRHFVRASRGPLSVLLSS